MRQAREFYVYIMSSFTGVLYIGMTNDLERRVFEHKQKLVPSFSAKYNTNKLVHYEIAGDARTAIEREKQLKGWIRSKKTALIGSANRNGWI